MNKNSAGSLVSILLLAVVLPWAIYSFGPETILDSARKFPAPTAALIFSALLVNSLVAAYRFKVVSRTAGHHITFRQAIATVAAGSLGGAMFFQLAGQLMARGVVMRRGRMPFAAVVAVTLYERLAAAALSAALALIGAFYIFGRVYLDQQAGGLTFIKIVCGILVAVTGGAVIGYGEFARRALAPLLNTKFVLQAVRFLLLALLVQIPTMIAYVLAAHALAPDADLGELIAASAIVMFAASVPISFAGWGVRELSAIVALGTVGVAANDALTAAIVVGLGSMLSMGLMLGFGTTATGNAAPSPEKAELDPIDYSRALSWCLPITTAVCVLFQIYIPIGSGLLNVNLADPIAMLTGGLFLVDAISKRRWPRWRAPGINLAAIVATASLGASLLLGAYRFGFTDWALINRFLGWFVLLAFAATGATIASVGGREGVRIMLLSYLGAALGVAVLELALAAASAVGPALPLAVVRPGNLEAFALNRNFFAFQILIAVAAGLIMLDKRSLRVAMLAVLLAALWYTGSRSSWLAIIAVLAAAIHIRRVNVKEIIVGVACAWLVVGAITLLPLITAMFQAGAIQASGIQSPPVWPTESATLERVHSLQRGWEMFTEYPIFGAGLGAFRNLNILADSGIPLLIHSTPLWLLAELGIVGFLVFAVPGVSIWVIEWRRARTEPLAAITVLCLVVFAVMSGPADMVYQRTFWLLIGAALAVPARWQEDKASSGNLPQ